MEIESAAALYAHYLRGGLFESFVINELIKYRANIGKRSNCYFWRDAQGHEIDCLLECGERLVPIEIKSGMTINQSFFDTLITWKEIAQQESEEAYLVYAGTDSQARKHAMVLVWDRIDLIMQQPQT